jgi:undecaprenyl-diphosphatase
MSATRSATPENKILKENASGHSQQFSPRAILTILVVVAIGVIAELIEANIQGPAHTSVDSFPQVISFWDTRAFLWINNGLANQYLGWIFSILTRLGSTDPILVVSVLLFAVGRKKEGTLLFTSVIIGSLVTLPLKLAIPRPRPYATVPATIAYGMELGSSFPSGHSMRAFASACVLSRFWSRFTLAFYLLAALVAFSRIYLGLHYPSDTLIGASIGLIVGYLSIRFQDKILKLFRLEA